MKQHTFAIIVGLVLFFIPFFWLAPGEMNLGGDAGRLYFYDPAAYLDFQAFYNYVRSGNGGEVVNYVYLPLVTLLFLLKHIFQSPTILISLFNGITLSVAFVSTYLIVKELLKETKNSIRSGYIELASILAGLFYILSQLSIHSGWERPIITHSQIFLNPLMTFFILKYMLTQKMKYLTFALLTTFIFTPNFSLIGAPPFFAFYPITTLFIFLYAKFVRKVAISYRLIAIGITLFLLIHAFHLVNEVGSIFSPGSAYNRIVFAQEGEGSRAGLNYFIAVASNIKVSRIWMSLAQFQKEPYFAIFIIFPLILVASFFLNRGKTLLLTGLFFLILLYFTSAITDTGFFAYKQLFKVPGFSMFRNFHAQWSYVFFFFYALLFGQALAIVVNKFSRRIVFLLFTVLTATIIGFGLPLLTGAVPILTDRDTGVRYAFRMDPIYERVLQFFRSDPIDGRVLVFPLTVNGYQIFQGKDGGVYQGLPTLSYLGGKAEIGGFETLRPFEQMFLTAMADFDYKTLSKLLSILNMRYVFYNSDPYIYSEPFQARLYDVVSNYAPNDQKRYKAFIEKLPITKVTDFGNTYHVYSVESDAYVPHIFATEEVRFTNNAKALAVDSYFQRDLRETPLPVQNALGTNDPMILYALPKTVFTEFKNNNHFHKHDPFINRRPDEFLYILVTLKEEYDLVRAKRDPSRYLDSALFFLTKRNFEMTRFGEDMNILRRPWQKPQLWEVHKWAQYNTWEASLARYEKGVEEILDWIEKVPASQELGMYNRIKLKEQLHWHETELLRTAKRNKKKSSEKEYLLSAINSMYERLYEKLHGLLIDSFLYTYELPEYANRQGTYEVYLKKDNMAIDDPSEITLAIGDYVQETLREAAESGLFRFADIKLDDPSNIKVTMSLPINNLAKTAIWSSSNAPIESEDNTTTMVFDNKLDDFSDGFTLEVPNWEPRKKYLISFEYNTNGEDLIFSFVAKQPVDNPVKKVAHKMLFEKRLNAKGFRTHQSVVVAEKNTVGGLLKISPFSPNDTNTIKIRNLIVQKVDYPKLVFKKIVPGGSTSQPPQVTFTKINPTKYVLDIKGAKSPYTLVFLEAFNSNWDLVDPATKDKTTIGHIWEVLGRLGKSVTGLFIKDISNEEATLTSYFNVDVREGIHTNTFLAQSTFETWGKRAIIDTTHTQAFEYANAWNISPEDMDGRMDYTLILELRTQRQFYPALFVSIITVVFLLGYTVRQVLLWSRKQ